MTFSMDWAFIPVTSVSILRCHSLSDCLELSAQVLCTAQVAAQAALWEAKASCKSGKANEMRG